MVNYDWYDAKNEMEIKFLEMNYISQSCIKYDIDKLKQLPFTRITIRARKGNCIFPLNVHSNEKHSER